MPEPRIESNKRRKLFTALAVGALTLLDADTGHIIKDSTPEVTHETKNQLDDEKLAVIAHEFVTDQLEKRQAKKRRELGIDDQADDFNVERLRYVVHRRESGKPNKEISDAIILMRTNVRDHANNESLNSEKIYAVVTLIYDFTQGGKATTENVVVALDENGQVIGMAN